MFGQRAQLAGLFAEIAHEELPHAKSLRRDAAHADQERISARAASESGGFGIEEAPFLGRDAADLAVRNRIEQIVREILQIHDADAAVAALAFVEPFGFVVDAVRGFDLFAVQPVFGGSGRLGMGFGVGGLRSGCACTFCRFFAMRLRRCASCS